MLTPSHREPGEPEVEARTRRVDAEAVDAALSGDQTAEAALGEAAERWSEITKELDAEKQRAAYLRSLGLEP